MLMSQKSKIHNTNHNKVNTNNNIAISPLAIPIPAGPGTIVTAMNHVTSTSYTHVAIVILIFGLIILLTYFAFSLSDLIVKKLGSNLISVIGKLMGLILAIIGTGMFTEGLKLAFKLN